MAKDTFDKLRSILAERESSPYSQDRNKYQEITAQYDNDLYNSPNYKLEQDINNAKSDMWGTSGIGGLVERFSDNFFSTLGNTITGLDLSDTTNQFGKEMTRNATMRMANLPDTAEVPHDKGVGAWLNYFTDINRGAIPQVANVGGSALSMLIPTALTMIPAGRVAGMAMKAGKNLPAVGRAVTALENSGNARQLFKDLGMGAISGQYEALAEKGATIDELEQMGLPHDEAVKQANEVYKENSALLTATNAVESALANPILRGIIPTFNVVDDVANGVRQVGRTSANAQALRRFANMVPKPITTTGKVAGSIAGNMALNGYEEGVQNQIQSAHTPTIDEDGNFVWKDYQSINDLMNPYQWSDESIRAAEEGAVGAGGLALLGHGAGGISRRIRGQQPNDENESTDPWENAFNTFKGQRMKNGDKGCVEAVTKIGAEAGNTWLGSQLEQSVVDGDTLTSNAQRDGLAVIAFDPANVERGDIILYNDTSKEGDDGLNVHSVIADGNGGIWGNSSSQHQVTSQDSYDMGSNLVPATIIKASAFNDGVVADNEFEDEFDGEENTASGSDTFLAKIGMQESGGNYDAVNPDSGAKGKYQIMPYNWQPWAEEAGLDGNAEMTPENQEIVARHKLIQYYDKYGEKGALVAWYAGEGNAERYVQGEATDVWGREWTAPQDGAPSIQSYVDEALAQNVPNGGRKRKSRKTPNVNTNSTGIVVQSDNATLDDYLKLFDDGNNDRMTYADYERLINSASDDEVLANANKAVMDYTQEGNLDSFTQLTEMIGDDDVDGLRELAKEHARAITIDEQSPNDNEIDNTADVQNEPINTFDFTEAINGLMEIANNGIQEQQVVARQALQSNAPLFVLNTYKQLTSGAPLEQHISEQNNDTVLPQTKLQQQPINDSRGIIEPTPQEQQQVNENVQQEARQQAESLNNNTPLTAQEQATANSVLNSADGVFAPQIKNELFNALRNGDNAGVRRVINGVPDNIPSQADVHQQSMAEIQESIGNARKNVNRAMAEKNLAGFLETLDEVEKEFMEFLDNLFYETGKGFIDVANGLISDVRRSRSEEKREVLINAIEGLAAIAGKAKEYEARRNELHREGGVGEAEGNRPVRQTEIPSEAREIAKAYGLQLKERLKQNNVGINEANIDRDLESGNPATVQRVVDRMENIAENNNVPVDDIQQVESAQNKKTTDDGGEALGVEENIKRGKEAIRRVQEKHIDVPNAMYRKEVGNIDFIYGQEGTKANKYKDGYGVAKIALKHGQKAIDMIPETIARGKFETSEYGDRVYFIYNGYRAVVRLTWDGNKQTWLVTNFLDKKIKNSDDVDAVVRSTPTTDGTISPSEQSSFLVSNISQEQEKSKQKKTLNEQLAEARAEKEELLGGFLKYIDETSGQGVDIIPLNDGSSRGVRSSKNAKWYSEWYQQNKQKHGKMSKKDKLDIAEQMYRGQIETEETAVVNRLSKEEFDKYQAEQKEAIEKLDAINAKIAQLEKAKEEAKNNNDKKKIPPEKGTSSNAKKKNAQKTTLTQQESQEGAASEPQRETPSSKNKPALNRKSEGQNSKAEMVKESGETATVSKAEIVGENIRDDFKLSRKINDAVRTSLITIDQLVLSGHSQKDIERYVKNTLNLVDTLSDFTADEKQVMKEVLQSRSKKAIDKAVKILERNGEPVNNADEHGVKLRAVKNTDSQIEKVRKQYEGTDQWMKAPNGKPTNLTERQWLQVRTPNFKNWFGDWENDPENASKVVDENGEPLVVYHGTPLGGFEVFNRELNYFTADKEYADRYQDPGASSDYVKGVREELGKAMTYPVFLNIRKPFDTRKAKERKIFEKEFYRQWGNGAPLSEKGLPDWTDSDDFREFFDENDYDYDGLLLDEGGVPTEDGNVKSRGISYVAFNSNQIKSATENNGEFNTENDNIKYSRAVSNPNSAESLKKNGDTDTRLDKLPKVDYTKLNKTEKNIMKFGKALGVPVHFVTHYDPNYRGVFTHNGEIFINRKATVPAKDIFIHEFVHWLKASGNENIYDSLSACLENIKGVSHAKQLSEYRKSIFNGERMTNDEIIEEIICDAMSHTVTANRLINDIGKINSSIAEKIVGHMKGLWDKFCNAVGYHQGKPISQQSLPNHLSANELAKMDAILNRQLANIKGKDGKPVFAFKNGKWTVARNGKTVGESYNTNPISATMDRQLRKNTNADKQLEEVRKQYEGTDQWMKAPNGKPTNLTERQWLQVRTPNFKNWFGDWENDPKNASKVIDENGEPKVMYHGTDALFDVFKRVTPKHGLNSGDGFYFTESKNVAESFGNKVLECFLNIRKPFDTTSVPTESKTFSKQNKEKAIEFFEQKYSDWEKNGKGYDRFKPQVELLSDGGFTITFATSYQAEVSNANDGVFNHEVVVFNPNQIKSATENNGEFNTENDNIKYSRSKPTDDTLSSDTQGLYQRATTALLKRLGFEKENDNVRVDRKSSNPNNLNIFNRFINSPSFLARYNKIVAPFVALGKQAVEKQEKLRTEFREELNDIEKVLGYKEASLNNLTGANDPKYKERKEALNTILFNGDVEGKEYTANELSEKGHDKETIEAYLKMRKLLNRAYDLLDRTVRQVKIGARNMTDGELADLKAENPFIEIVSVNDVEGDKKRKRYTYRYPTVERKTEQLLSSDIKELKQNSDVKVISIKKLSGERYEVEYIQRRSLNKIKGYVPHMFHEWAVVEVDKDGKILKDENGNSKFLQTFNTMNEAIKYANKSDKKGYYRVMPKVHEVAGASERAFIMGDYNYFKKMGKVEEDFLLTPEEATEIANSDIRTSNRGRFLGNLMKRKGVKNYEKDLFNATYQYLNQVGRYVALDPYKRLSYALYERNFGKWGNEKVYMGELGQTAKYIRTYINAINGVPNNVEMAFNNALHTLGIGKEVANGRPALWFIHWLTYPMTILKLGMVNVSSALLNVTQLCNTFGAMGDISLQNIKRLSKNAAITYWKAWKDHNSNEGKLLWDELGLKTQLGMDVAGGYSKAEVDGLANLQGKISKLAGKSMFLFRGTDSFGRGVTLLTAYQKAIDEGKSHKEAIRYAKMVNTRVNFDYSVADANGIYNRLGAVANLILQFQKYPMKQLELFYDIFKEQKEMNKDKNFTNARAFGALLKYTAPYMALSGIAGVPFISLVGSLLGFVSGDDDKDLVAEFRAMLRNNFGDNAITRVLGYGALGIIDINTGSRIGVGDFLGGNANMKKTKVEIFAETVGGTTISTALQIGKQLWNENYLEALKALNPSIGNVFIGLRGDVRTTRGRLKYTYANGYEQFIRGLGFTPVGETLASELASEDYKNRQKEQETKKEAIDKFLANPSAENAKLLNDLGITPKSLKTERERKNKTSHEINQEKEKKKKEKEKKIQKKKVYSVNDYQKEK